MPAVKLSETPDRIRWGLPPGTGFVRLAIGLARGGSDARTFSVVARAGGDWADTPAVRQILLASQQLPLSSPIWAKAVLPGPTDSVWAIESKAAVAPGTTTDSAWASALLPFQSLASEFVELLRPRTIIGRLPGVRKVPFNVHMSRATGGVSAGWVGQTKPKPLSKMAFDNIYLGFTKIAAHCAIANELARFSSPAAEAVVSRDMSSAIIASEDLSFIDPTIAAVADTSPASITNGITPITSSGSTVADIISDVALMFAAGIAGNVSYDNGAWIMHPRTANYLGSLLTTGGQRMWPEINIRGGMWYGLPVIVSASVPVESGGDTTITLIDGGEVFLADDGGVTLSTSTQASLQMLSDPATGATTEISMFQANLIAIRTERYCNWTRRHDAGVQVLESVAF